MAEDYLTDDEQLEVVKHAFVEYAPWIIGGVFVGAALFFGYRYYQSYTDGRALKAATQFSAMTAALQLNDHAKSRQVPEPQARVCDGVWTPSWSRVLYWNSEWMALISRCRKSSAGSSGLPM